MWVLRWVAVALVSSIVGVSAMAVEAPSIDGPDAPPPRAPAPESRTTQEPPRSPDFIQQTAARRLEEMLEGLTIRWDSRAGSPRALFRQGGFLTEPSPATPRDVAWAFLSENADLFGLEPRERESLVEIATSTDPETGTSHFGLQQTVDGVPVLRGVLGFHITREGHATVHTTCAALTPEKATASAT